MIAMGIAKELESGIEVNGKVVSVDVNFLGLYDPVDSTALYEGSDTISSNVGSAAVAKVHSGLFSRPLFDRLEGKAEPGSKTRVERGFFTTSHGGVGGNPGSAPPGMSRGAELRGAKQAGDWVRHFAGVAGIKFNTNQDKTEDMKIGRETGVGPRGKREGN